MLGTVEETQQTQRFKKIEWILAIAFFLAAQGFTFHRLFLGVNFFDEPFYSGIPFRFYLGQKLFIHELFLLQSFGILTLPLVKLHFLLFQSTESIILSMRICFFILYFILSLFVARTLRKQVGDSTALIIASTCALFLPGNIPTVSYNTLATFFLIVGLFLFNGVLINPGHKKYFWVGLFLGLSTLSYNSFLLMLLFVMVLIISNSSSRGFLLSYCAGIAVVGAWPLILVFSRWNYLKDAIVLSKEYGYSSNKLYYIFTAAHKLFPKQVLACVLLYGVLMVVSLLKKQQHLSRALAIILPFVAMLLSYLSTAGWATYPFYLSLLSLSLIPLIRHKPGIDPLVFSVFVPSFFSGIVAGVSSNVGFTNSQVGLVPAFLVGLVFVALSFDSKSLFEKILKSLCLGVPIIFVFFTDITIWDESPSKDLIVKVAEGPFKGLYTTAEKKEYLHQVSQDILTSLDSKGPLLIYPNFTAGYLIAGVPPATGVIWYQNPKGGVDEIWAKAYQNEMGPNSRFLKMKWWYASPKLKHQNQFISDNPMTQLIEQHHSLVKDTPSFTLYKPHLDD